MNLRFEAELRGLENQKLGIINKSEKVLFLSVEKMMNIAKKKAPVDTGELRRRINMSPKSIGANEYILSDGVSYGVHLEYGTTPDEVKWEPLEKWVKRKGIASGEDDIYIATKYIIEKIEREGVNAQPFFRPALQQVKNIELQKIKGRVFGKD